MGLGSAAGVQSCHGLNIEAAEGRSTVPALQLTLVRLTVASHSTKMLVVLQALSSAVDYSMKPLRADLWLQNKMFLIVVTCHSPQIEVLLQALSPAVD